LGEVIKCLQAINTSCDYTERRIHFRSDREGLSLTFSNGLDKADTDDFILNMLQMRREENGREVKYKRI
jgi:hypothetical protein